MPYKTWLRVCFTLDVLPHLSRGISRQQAATSGGEIGQGQEYRYLESGAEERWKICRMQLCKLCEYQRPVTETLRRPHYSLILQVFHSTFISSF